MMNIKVPGMGCANCRSPITQIPTVARETAVAIELERVEGFLQQEVSR